nr:uncharacterized protein LOC111754112 [Cavia porcellus]
MNLAFFTPRDGGIQGGGDLNHGGGTPSGPRPERRHSSRGPSSLGQLGGRGSRLPSLSAELASGRGVPQRKRRAPQPPLGGGVGHPFHSRRVPSGLPQTTGQVIRGGRGRDPNTPFAGSPTTPSRPPTARPQLRDFEAPASLCRGICSPGRPGAEASRRPRPHSHPSPAPARFPNNLLALPARHARCARPPPPAVGATAAAERSSAAPGFQLRAGTGSRGGGAGGGQETENAAEPGAREPEPEPGPELGPCLHRRRRRLPPPLSRAAAAAASTAASSAASGPRTLGVRVEGGLSPRKTQGTGFLARTSYGFPSASGKWELLQSWRLPSFLSLVLQVLYW